MNAPNKEVLTIKGCPAHFPNRYFFPQDTNSQMFFLFVEFIGAPVFFWVPPMIFWAKPVSGSSARLLERKNKSMRQ